MFEEPRNLIVVYKEKDEVSLNQLKKMELALLECSALLMKRSGNQYYWV